MAKASSWVLQLQHVTEQVVLDCQLRESRRRRQKRAVLLAHHMFMTGDLLAGAIAKQNLS